MAGKFNNLLISDIYVPDTKNLNYLPKTESNDQDKGQNIKLIQIANKSQTDCYNIPGPIIAKVEENIYN